jgi:MFS family permease
MIAADLVRVAVFALLPFTTTPGQIVALALVAGLGNGFFRNAVYAGVPNLVPEDELPSANSLLQTVENVSWTIGPLLGGILTAAAGPNAAYWINAVSFLVSAVLVSRIPAVKLQSETALSKGHWTDLKDGFVAVFRSRMMLAVLFGWGIALFGSGAINVGEIFLAKNVLGAGDFGYGLLYGSMGLGLVIGSFWSAAIVDRVGVARAYGAALLVCSVGFGVGALSIGIWMAAACCVVGGFGNGVAIVCNVLLLQRGSTDEMRGRSFTFVMSVTHLLAGAGLLVAGALLPSQGARWLWGLGALTIGLGAIVGYTLAREPRGSAVPAAEA